MPTEFSKIMLFNEPITATFLVPTIINSKLQKILNSALNEDGLAVCFWVFRTSISQILRNQKAESVIGKQLKIILAESAFNLMNARLKTQELLEIFCRHAFGKGLFQITDLLYHHHPYMIIYWIVSVARSTNTNYYRYLFLFIILYLHSSIKLVYNGNIFTANLWQTLHNINQNQIKSKLFYQNH